MRYVSATGQVPGGYQEPYSAGAAFLRGSALAGGRAAVSALDQLAGDAKLAAVFRQMRAIVGLSEAEMARRIGTNLSTVLDFEAGAVHALPAWPEIVRIVDRYAELSEIDPSPILSRLLTLIPASAPTQPVPIQPIGPSASKPTARKLAPPITIAAKPTVRQALPPGPSLVPSAPPATLVTRIESTVQNEPGSTELPPGFDGRAREREATARTARQQAAAGDTHEQGRAVAAARRRRRTRRTIALTLPIVAVAGLFVAMLMAPRPFYGLARLLPAPIDMPVRGMVDLAVTQTAPMREGLRWIEMDDPRIRKGDRIGVR